MGFGNKDLLILGLMCMLRTCFSDCPRGFKTKGRECVDENECGEVSDYCGNNTHCFNTIGSYYCQCKSGFRNRNGDLNFTQFSGQCLDINECQDSVNICGPAAHCTNQIGNYSCTCHVGYTSSISSPGNCTDIDECKEAGICGEKGMCKNVDGSYWCECPEGYTTDSKEMMPCSDIDECKEAGICGEKGMCKNVDGSYWCECPEGYTTYGKERTPCSELNCGKSAPDSGSAQALGGLADISSMMRNNCLTLSNPSAAEKKGDGEALLEKLLTATDNILSPAPLKSSKHVSMLLSTVENFIKLIGPQLKNNYTKMETTETEAEIVVQRGRTPPTGPILLTNENARLDTDWETATGMGTYPGFALAALLSYKNLNVSDKTYFEDIKEYEKDGVDPSFSVCSKVVSVVVSNPSTQNLSRSVNITLKHQVPPEKSLEVSYVCAYWNEIGAWSTDGCDRDKQRSNASYTVCTCKHLSSFAVLMATYPMEHTFGLQVVTKIGLTISILCLILSILTFKFCRSIQGTRTTIHLHLCICLFLADLFFLAGISQTKPVGGCRFIAAMLHYFFLGVFTWMLLEGVQLYRMVVLVFNATMRPLYLFIAGYGPPLVIVIMSAIIRPNGYGTKQHCWLSLEDGLIWSFFGPVCFIIIVNVFFFIITVWKLAQKFTSLNPDLSKLHKMKAFTVTAIAQMCILGLMWVFGAFLFQEGTIVVAYIFTILNSLQGALVFIMHCLLSKQVREEYAHFLSCICTPQKKRYSDFSSSNPSSSQSQASRSGQHTGESQI
ncbi:adhesion G protein-coupled receptor E2 isoform X2 [Toxotes jaculatrix]|uniref:adhesion G protein-coupled receptor E2 isoform X2 n=1 Tax=Toxotes jaculatrix TaxID=941984 RepID=UPI001B3ACBC7|nr:adhesion G protein-coupled receptor E2 isoform X2 [Toxotes jaculatrix]